MQSASALRDLNFVLSRKQAMQALNERKDFTKESFAKNLNQQLDELMDVERQSRLSVSCVNQMLSLIEFEDSFFKDRKT